MTTPEQFAAEMGAIRDVSEADPERYHGEADDLLCQMLEELGYKEGVELFRDMEKWYG